MRWCLLALLLAGAGPASAADDDVPEAPVATVDVVDRYGEQVTIPLSQLQLAYERGYRLATGKEIVAKMRQEQSKRRRSDIADGVLAFCGALALLAVAATMLIRRRRRP